MPALRRPVETAQYLSIRYAERLGEAGNAPSAGSVGDSRDNALAETIDGPFKAGVIHRRGPWRDFPSRRICHPRMGGSVRHPPPPRADRKHPAGASGARLHRGSGNRQHGRATNRNKPPANPERFRRPAGARPNSMTSRSPPGCARNIAREWAFEASSGCCKGRVRYRLLDPFSETILDPDHPGLILPDRLHRVEPPGPMRMQVDFYDRSAGV